MKQDFFESSCFTPSLVNGQAFFHNTYYNFSFPKHFHDEFLIQIITHGQNKFYCNGSMFDAGPGDVVLINPGEVHNGTSRHGEKLEYKVFYVDPSTWTDVLGGGTGLLSNNSFSLRQTLVKDAVLFSKINTYFNSLPGNGDIRLHEKYMDILFFIASKYSSVKPDNSKQDFYHKDALNLLKEYIRDNLEDKLLLGQLSKVSAISPFHLLRLFKKHTGITLHQFIMVRRIEKAKYLLKKKKPISDVAYSLGFSDQSHFTRSFKMMSGVTPRQFRKSYI